MSSKWKKSRDSDQKKKSRGSLILDRGSRWTENWGREKGDWLPEKEIGAATKDAIVHQNEEEIWEEEDERMNIYAICPTRRVIYFLNYPLKLLICQNTP